MDLIRIFSIIFSLVVVVLAIQTGKFLGHRGYRIKIIYGHIGFGVGAVLVFGAIYLREKLGYLSKFEVLTIIAIGAIFLVLSTVIIFSNSKLKVSNSDTQ